MKEKRKEEELMATYLLVTQCQLSYFKTLVKA